MKGGYYGSIFVLSDRFFSHVYEFSSLESNNKLTRAFFFSWIDIQPSSNATHYCQARRPSKLYFVKNVLIDRFLNFVSDN